MYEVLRVPMAFTWEIYGDEQATFDDCFRMFNPLTQVGEGAAAPGPSTAGSGGLPI
jgi:hypothetical protein